MRTTRSTDLANSSAWTGVRGRGDEHSLVGALAGEGTVEALHIWSPDDALPALGLNVHLLQAELVERDHPVDAAISDAANPLQVVAIDSVTHSVEQVENDGLEVLRGGPVDGKASPDDRLEQALGELRQAVAAELLEELSKVRPPELAPSSPASGRRACSSWPTLRSRVR